MQVDTGLLVRLGGARQSNRRYPGGGSPIVRPVDSGAGGGVVSSFFMEFID